MFKQQQRCGATTVEQFAVLRLGIQRIHGNQIAQENAQRMGIFFWQIFRRGNRLEHLLLMLP